MRIAADPYRYLKCCAAQHCLGGAYVTIWIARPGQVGKLDHRLVNRRTVRRGFLFFRKASVVLLLFRIFVR